MTIEDEKKVRTIELTHKKLKLLTLAGWFIFLAGCYGMYDMFSSVNDGSMIAEQIPLWPAYALPGGLIVLIYARFMIWWHHG